ncbi:Glutamate synthase, alpha subunit, C-terminal [Phytophthora cactorum]|nr:Glutamate synthase, alpha subunit, C-terminal [Phytophthora cactorum]
MIKDKLALDGNPSMNLAANFSGKAGERFCVRNSGVKAVVEGVGAHGCEYMTGGRVIILGLTGCNFAAGMSGGIAYIFDEDQTFQEKCNMCMVGAGPLTESASDAEIEEVKALIAKHLERTQSPKRRRCWTTGTRFCPAPCADVSDYERVLLQHAAVVKETRSWLRLPPKLIM